jgi:hypothetical protein
MNKGALQLLQPAMLAAVAVATHVLIVRIQRPITRQLEGIAGAVMRAFGGISDVLRQVFYVGFIALLEPASRWGSNAQAFEDFLDTLGLFAFLVVAVELIRIKALYRIANALEPWPPSAAEAA